MFDGFDSLRPSQHFFQLCRDGYSWVEPVLSKDKCVSRTQHSDADEARNRGPSVSSQALYH